MEWFGWAWALDMDIRRLTEQTKKKIFLPYSLRGNIFQEFGNELCLNIVASLKLLYFSLYLAIGWLFYLCILFSSFFRVILSNGLNFLTVFQYYYFLYLSQGWQKLSYLTLVVPSFLFATTQNLLPVNICARMELGYKVIFWVKWMPLTLTWRMEGSGKYEEYYEYKNIKINFSSKCQRQKASTLSTTMSTALSSKITQQNDRFNN
jgi:hypothetical protein